MAIQTIHDDGPVRSDFSDDADFRELLELFVDTIGEKQQDLQSAFDRRDFERLGSVAHQLKGAGGGYGFDGLTAVAAEFELACKQNAPDQIERGFAELISYLGRIRL